MITNNCLVCGKSIQTFPSINKKTCSDKCHSIWMSKQRTNNPAYLGKDSPRWKNKSLEEYQNSFYRICPICKKTFKRKHFIKKFCSNECYKKAVSNRQKGEANSNWKGGCCYSYYCRIYKEYYGKLECEVCKTENNLDIHHKDGNHFNNNPENLSCLCRKHHMEIDNRLAELIKRNKEI